MSTTLKWSTFDDAKPDSFNVYRAITGITVTFPNSLVIGDRLVFAATSSTQQTIVITATDIDTVISNINTAAKGIVASKNLAGTKLFIRCTAVTNPKLKLFPCTFLTDTGLQPGLIGPRQTFLLIGNVAFVSTSNTYMFADPDGNTRDWYHITALTGAVESIPSQDQQPLIVPPDVCVVEGRISDLKNDPIAGAIVRAKIMIPPGEVENIQITKEELTTITDEYGRWEMQFIQNQQVLFTIDDIGFINVAQLPVSTAVLFKDLELIKDYYFSPSEDPIGGGVSEF